MVAISIVDSDFCAIGEHVDVISASSHAAENWFILTVYIAHYSNARDIDMVYFLPININ